MVKPSEIKNLYERLGVSRTASEQELKAAYRTLAHQWHPDHNPGREPESKIEFIAVSEAYKEISVDAQRIFKDLPKSEGEVNFYKLYEDFLNEMDKVSPGLGSAVKMFSGSGLPPSMESILGSMFR